MTACSDRFMHLLRRARRYLEAAADDPALQAALEVQVREYGRTPAKMFRKKHPRRKGPSRMDRLLQACACGLLPAAGAGAGAPRPPQR